MQYLATGLRASTALYICRWVELEPYKAAQLEAAFTQCRVFPWNKRAETMRGAQRFKNLAVVDPKTLAENLNKEDMPTDVDSDDED